MSAGAAGATLFFTSVPGPLASGPSGPWVQKLVPFTMNPVRHGPASTGTRPSKISPRSGRLGGTGRAPGAALVAAPAAAAGSTDTAATPTAIRPVIHRHLRLIDVCISVLLNRAVRIWTAEEAERRDGPLIRDEWFIRRDPAGSGVSRRRSRRMPRRRRRRPRH